MNLDTAINHERRYCQTIRDILCDAKRCFWSHDKILDKLNELVYNDPSFSKCPRYIVAYVQGYFAASINCYMRDNTLSAHMIDGEAYVIGSSEYRALEPRYVTENSEGCVSVYAENTSKIF